MSQLKRPLLFATLVVFGVGLAACHGSSSNGTSSNGTASNGASSSDSSSTGITSGGTGSGLIPLVTGDNKLELLDPSKAIGSGNPVIVDTGVPNQLHISTRIAESTGYDPYHPPGDMTQFVGFQTGTINSSTGALSNFHTGRVAYIKGSPGAGKLFTVSTVLGDSHAPVQVSDISNACGVSQQFGPGLIDFSNPIDSWILVGLPGKDGACFTRDDQFVAVKLNTPATRPGVSVAGLRSALALYDSSGAIAGFLDDVASANGTGTTEHRDANFANPTTVFTSSSGQEPLVDDLSTTQIYFAFVPSGQSTYELYRYDVATRRLSAALYTFANGRPNLLFVVNPADASNYYFTDGNKVLRISRSATAAGQTVLMTTLPSEQQDVRLALTANRVVGDAIETPQQMMREKTLRSIPLLSVFSVPTGASNATATTLASNAALQSADPSGLVFITKRPFSDSGEWHTDAIIIHDDGTGMSSTANATWVGSTHSTSIANIGIGFELPPAMVLRDTVSNPSDRFATHTLTAINASTGALLNTLGSIPNSVGMGGAGVGRYAGITASVNLGGSAHSDLYIANSQAADSLKPVSTVNGHNAYIWK